MTEKRTAPARSEGPPGTFRSGLPRVARAVTRPIVTIIFAAVIAQLVTQGITAPDWFIYGLAMPCILWWFGERTIAHWKEKK